MAREIESVHVVTEESFHPGPDKERCVVRCDDSAVYEFERFDDEPAFELVRRWTPDGGWSTSNGILPSALKETMQSMFGDDGWVKGW